MKLTLSYLHSIVSLLLEICCIGWIILIEESTNVNGQLPKYGDIETISLNGSDRVFVMNSL